MSDTPELYLEKFRQEIKSVYDLYSRKSFVNYWCLHSFHTLSLALVSEKLTKHFLTVNTCRYTKDSVNFGRVQLATHTGHKPWHLKNLAKKTWLTSSCGITRLANNLQWFSVHFWYPLMSIIHQVTDWSEVKGAQTKRACEQAKTGQFQAFLILQNRLTSTQIAAHRSDFAQSI